jgi:hypothetical protein
MYRRVKILRRTTYAHATLAVGEVATIDNDLADKWVKAGIAAPASAASEIWTQCPKCQASFQIPATPKRGEFWVQCKNVHCSYGWAR